MNPYLIKIAQLSSDTKKELAQTGVMATVGGVTSYAASKALETGAIKGIKMSAGGKTFILGAGLGLLGDYGAVKLNRGIEKKANMKNNKYLEKVANTYDSTTLAHLGNVDISQAKDVTPKSLDSLKGLISKNKAIASAAALAGIGGVGYLATRKKNKEVEKKAGLLINGIKRGAQRLGGQLKTLGEDIVTAPKTVAGIKSMKGSVMPILKNRAVQTGAGVVATGVAARTLSGSGQSNK